MRPLSIDGKIVGTVEPLALEGVGDDRPVPVPVVAGDASSGGFAGKETAAAVQHQAVGQAGALAVDFVFCVLGWYRRMRLLGRLLNSRASPSQAGPSVSPKGPATWWNCHLAGVVIRLNFSCVVAGLPETTLFHPRMIRREGRAPDFSETTPVAGWRETGSKSSMSRLLINIDAQDAQDYLARGYTVLSSTIAYTSTGIPKTRSQAHGSLRTRTRSSSQSASPAAASRPVYPVYPVYRCSQIQPTGLTGHVVLVPDRP